VQGDLTRHAPEGSTSAAEEVIAERLRAGGVRREEDLSGQIRAGEVDLPLMAWYHFACSISPAILAKACAQLGTGDRGGARDGA